MSLGDIASPTKSAAAYDFSKLDDEESDDFQQAVEMLHKAVRTKKKDYKDNEDSFMLSKEDTEIMNSSVAAAVPRANSRSRAGLRGGKPQARCYRPTSTG